MEKVHKKTALKDAADLILAAHDLGEGLLWERYEQQLPLCAFTSNGLNCRKCFQGPCRISPFGDEPSRGVCGADRDQIVMETLFQSTREGVLETAQSLRLLGIGGADQGFADMASDLPAETQKRLGNLGLLPVKKDDLFGVQNSYFAHKGYLDQTLWDLTRLGLIHYGLLKQAEASLDRTVRKVSPFDPEGVNLLVVGQAPIGFVEAVGLQAHLKSGARKINLLALGGHGPSFTRMACDHGSPELALGTNVDALVVAPNALFPGLETLAKKYNLPVILMDRTRSLSEIASEAVGHAVEHAKKTVRGTTASRVVPTGEGGDPIVGRAKEVRQALASGQLQGVLVLLGEANVKQTFFDRTLALMRAALAEKVLVLLGGGIASAMDLLVAELESEKGNQLAPFSAELAKEGLALFSTFGSALEIPRVVSFLGNLAGGRELFSLPVIVAFPEFYRTSTWATAVSFLSIGCAVQIGTRLPFWGSPSLAGLLLSEWPEITGGKLLAAPALPDSKGQAEEMVSFLKTKRVS